MASPKKAKIAVVIPKYGLVGGGERFAAEVTERLAVESDFEFHVFANRWRVFSDRVTFHRVPVVRFPRFLTTVSFAALANRQIAGQNFNLVHAHDRIFKADLFTMHGVPHRFWVSEVRRKGMSLFDLATAWVEKKMVEEGGCRRFLAVSQLALGKFLEQYPAAGRLAEVVYPGVALSRFERFDGAAASREIRDRYGIAPQSPLLLFVSMNFELKGLERIMRAIAMHRKGGATVPPTLLVVGKGNRRKFEAIARDLDIAGLVVFAGVWEQDIEKLYLAGDAFVMLSDFDTFGMAVLEAMAASCPVIVSQQVGARDLVAEGVNGFVVDRQDIGQISERLATVLQPGNRERMGYAARQTAEEYSWERVAERVAEVYRTLLTH